MGIHLIGPAQDASGYIRLVKYQSFAMKYQGRTMKLTGDNDASAFTFLDNSIYSTKLIGNSNQEKKLYIGIDPSKIFAKLRVYKEGTDNQSINTWYMDKFGPSVSPTIAPTNSFMPSQVPSESLCVKNTCEWQPLGNAIIGSLAFYNGNMAYANNLGFSFDGTRVCMGEPNVTGSAKYTGQVRVFELQDNIWTPIGQVLSGDAYYDSMGPCDLSSDGNRLLVGSYRHITVTPSIWEAGKVQVFDFDDSVWQQVGQTLYGSIDSVHLGSSVKLAGTNGSRLLVNEYKHDNQKGKVMLYELIETTWVHIINFVGMNDGDRFGHSYAITPDGKTVVASSITGDLKGDMVPYPAGYAMVFHETETGWKQKGSAFSGTLNKITYQQIFGHSVDISADGTRVAVGAPHWNRDDTGDNKSGFVQVFDYDSESESWEQKGQTIYGQKTVFPVSECGKYLSLSEDGSRLIVASPVWNENQGRVRIYDLKGDQWVQQGSDLQGQQAHDFFGLALRISGDGKRVVVKSEGVKYNIRKGRFDMYELGI